VAYEGSFVDITWVNGDLVEARSHVEGAKPNRVRQGVEACFDAGQWIDVFLRDVV